MYIYDFEQLLKIKNELNLFIKKWNEICVYKIINYLTTIA